MKELKSKIDKALSNEITKKNYHDSIALIRRYPRFNKQTVQRLKKRFRPDKLKSELKKVSEKLAYHIVHNPTKWQHIFSEEKPKEVAKESSESKKIIYNGVEELEKEKSKVIGQIRGLSNSLIDLKSNEERKEVADKISDLEARLQQLNKMTALPKTEIKAPDIAELKRKKGNVKSYISKHKKAIEAEEAKGKQAEQKKLDSLYRKLKSREQELIDISISIENILGV